MTTTLKEDALEAARLLAAAENATMGSGEAISNSEGYRKVRDLHGHLRRALYRHRKQLGLSDRDVAQIDNEGVQVFGGTPKGPLPEEP